MQERANWEQKDDRYYGNMLEKIGRTATRGRRNRRKFQALMAYYIKRFDDIPMELVHFNMYLRRTKNPAQYDSPIEKRLINAVKHVLER